MAKIHANNDNTWSMTASSEVEAFLFLHSLNDCLAHPELDTPEKIHAWLAAQESQEDDEEES